MTARDLLQQRFTLPNGDTAWRPSPLVTAAMEGKLLLLDGIHRVNLGTLAVLSRYFSSFPIVIFSTCSVDIDVDIDDVLSTADQVLLYVSYCFCFLIKKTAVINDKGN